MKSPLYRCFCLILGIVGTYHTCCGQALSGGSEAAGTANRAFYLGLEGIIFANRPTQFTRTSSYVTAEPTDYTPCPALVVGYQFTPRFALEGRTQELSVMTGYTYKYETPAAYLGFGQSYYHSYLYLPVQGVWQLLGRQSRLKLGVVAGGGPAFTNARESIITPNGTKEFSSSPNGTIGTGPAGSFPPGTVKATVTQLITQERGFFMAFEAGLRGSWQVRPRWALDLTVRQLWSTTSSARDMQLDIQRDTERFSTTMQSPVRGVCTGLSLRYFL